MAEPPSITSQGALLSLAVIPHLYPAFSPDVHDYVVRCIAGDNALSLAFETTPGATLSVSTPAALLSNVDATQSLSITLSEDDPVVVETMGRGAPQQYWVRCLPHDFPTIQFTPHPDAGAPTPGWYLTGNATAATGETGFAMILDSRGTPGGPSAAGRRRATPVDRLPTGTMSFISALGAFRSGTRPPNTSSRSSNRGRHATCRPRTTPSTSTSCRCSRTATSFSSRIRSSRASTSRVSRAMARTRSSPIAPSSRLTRRAMSSGAGARATTSMPSRSPPHPRRAPSTGWT